LGRGQALGQQRGNVGHAQVVAALADTVVQPVLGEGTLKPAHDRPPHAHLRVVNAQARSRLTTQLPLLTCVD
jgi:protocatechuate 3,4-dioxygenase beta subunit